MELNAASDADANIKAHYAILTNACTQAEMETLSEQAYNPGI